MSDNTTVMRFLTPALAALATIIALFGQWFTKTTSITNKTIDSTLLEVLQGQSFVEYTSSRWVWISGVGVLLVIGAAFLGLEHRRDVAVAGSYLLMILPVWSLFQVYVGEENLGAGWGMWIAVVLSIAVLVLVRMIPKSEPAVQAPLEQPREDATF